MKVYYLEFFASKTPVDQMDSPREDKRARFWVLDRDPDGALRRAHHYLVEHGWQPVELTLPPVRTKEPEDDNVEQHAGYEEACRHGIAMVIKEC